MASAADVARLRRANAGIVEHVSTDLTTFWGSLNLAKPEAARNALLEFVPLLVAQYGDVAATVAADWYDELRASAGVRGRFAAVMAATAPEDAIAGSVRYGAGHLFTDNPSATLAFLEGSVSRMALQAGRDTIVGSTRADPQADGWYRISGGGCDFCDFLAGRGAVYREATVDFAAHDRCRCGVAPSWDPSRPEADVQQYVASERTSAMTPDQRAAHSEQIRNALAKG